MAYQNMLMLRHLLSVVQGTSQQPQFKEDTVEPSVPARKFNLKAYAAITWHKWSGKLGPQIHTRRSWQPGNAYRDAINSVTGAGHRVMGYRPANFGDTTTICFRFMGQPTRLRLITWPCDLDLRPWKSRRRGWCGSSSFIRIPSLKFVGLGIRKTWRTMCVSINGPGDHDLWPWTGMRVASKMGNLHSKFRQARPLDSRIIRMYVTDGRSDRRTPSDGRMDGQKQRLLLLPYGSGGITTQMYSTD